jgi:hypothetical protein
MSWTPSVFSLSFLLYLLFLVRSFSPVVPVFSSFLMSALFRSCLSVRVLACLTYLICSRFPWKLILLLVHYVVPCAVCGY